MFGQMAEARHDAPRAPADRHRVAFEKTPVLARRRRYEGRVVALAIAQLVERRLVGQAMPREMPRRALAARSRAVARRHHAAQHVLAERDPQTHVPALLVAAFAQPARETEVIR